MSALFDKIQPEIPVIPVTSYAIQADEEQMGWSDGSAGQAPALHFSLVPRTYTEYGWHSGMYLQSQCWGGRDR